MTEWQPIETASKKKKDVLLFTKGEIIIGWYNTRTKKWCYQDLYLYVETPTHWMPLPPPPKLAD
jgi:hypothetical protein